MPSDIVLISLAFLFFTAVREYMHYLQSIKLQELLKSVDITEYYKAVRPDTPRPIPASQNTIMDEQNEISFDDPSWDFSRIQEVDIDGRKQPMNIIK